MKIIDTQALNLLTNKLTASLQAGILTDTEYTKVETILSKLDSETSITISEKALVDKILGTINYTILSDGRLNIGTKSPEDKVLAKAYLDEKNFTYEEDEVSFYISSEFVQNFNTIIVSLAKIIK